MGERAFILATVRNNYLFPEDLPAQVDPDAYATPEDLLKNLIRKSKAEGKDRWSALVRKDRIRDPQAQLQGTPDEDLDVDEGFGFRHALRGGQVIVTDVLPGSGASEAGLRRGDEILATGKTPTMSNTPGAPLNAFGLLTSWGAQAGGRSVRYFRIRRAPSDQAVDLSITQKPFQAPLVERCAILHREAGHTVGYLRFRRFEPAAQPGLLEAFARFKRDGVTDLVLDLRYNPGGREDILQLVLDLLRAHPQPDETMYRELDAGGRTMVRPTFSERPESIRPRKIAVIVTGDSASASEALANALAPYYHHNLALVGARTGGKPVGTKIFPIPGSLLALKLVTARIVNRDGVGDYYRGLPHAPFQGSTCAAEDDPAHAPGDPAEASTRTALSWILHGTVPHGPIR